MMFCKVVCKVSLPWPPIESELALGFAILQPVVSHVHRLGSLWLSFAVYYSLNRQIVGLDWDFWLRMAHFGEYLSNVYHFFCI
jgi:hypothetical protein